MGVATNAAPRRGTIIMEGISDDGCLSVESFDWSGIDIVTTKPPTTAPKTTQPIITVGNPRNEDMGYMHRNYTGLLFCEDSLACLFEQKQHLFRVQYYPSFSNPPLCFISGASDQ